MVENKKAKPFIRYVGSKRKQAVDIVNSLGYFTGTYYEPFLGGGAVFFELANRRGKPPIAHLSDVNELLVNTWRVVRDQPVELMRLLDDMQPYVFDSSFYYSLRERLDCFTVDVNRAAWFVYMNKTCFQGLWRVNKKGQFNVPIGNFASAPKLYDRENIFACATALANTQLNVCDFRLVPLAGFDYIYDAFYFDPPYVPLSVTSNFTSYDAGGFGSIEQFELIEYAKRVRDRNGTFVVSNSTAARPIWEGHGFDLIEVDAPRALNSDATKRGAIKEIRIIYNPPTSYRG